MRQAIFRHRAFLAALLTTTAMCSVLPLSEAEAACTSDVGATLLTISCVGPTPLPAPIDLTLPTPPLPASAAVILGASGTPADISFASGTPLVFTLTDPTGIFTLDTVPNSGVSSIVGGGSGLVVSATGGGSILIGQAMVSETTTITTPSGAVIEVGPEVPTGVTTPLNANITALGGDGIAASVNGSGRIAIATATGTTIMGSRSGIVTSAVDGATDLVFGGNVTGLGQAAIAAAATGAGNISIATATGSVVSSRDSSAITVDVVNGNADITINGTATNPTFPGYSVVAFSSGAGSLSIAGSGNIAQGILAEVGETGTGGITIGGTGSIINTLAGNAPFGLLTARILNPGSDAAINITRSGEVSALAEQGGIYATNAGSGTISITGIGNVTAGLFGIYARANGGSVTIAPAAGVIGSDAIVAVTTGAGNIAVSTVGNIAGVNGYGIATGAASGITTVDIGAGSTVAGTLGALKLVSTGGDIVVNNAGVLLGSVNISTSGFDPTITNTGTINGNVSVVGDLVLNNFGTINGNVTATGASAITNANRISLVNGSTTDVLAATNYIGQNGVFAIDVNPTSTAATQRADLLTTTNLSGSTAVEVSVVGPVGLITTPIPVINATNVAPGTRVVVANSPGLIDYSIEQSGGTFNLVSTVNTSVASATPTGIDAILTSLNTGFFQNASAFVADPPDPAKNQINGGPWVRFAGGYNQVSVVTAAQNPTGTAFAPANVGTTFSGYQVGIDLGVANVEGTGWNTHLGVTAGEVLLRTNDLFATNIRSNVKVPYIGVYGALTGHKFYADFQVRGDFYNMSLLNPAAFLSGSNLGGRALAVNASAGYRFDLPASWFVEPSVAFLYSKLYVDTLRVGLDPSGTSFGSLDFNPFTSYLGRLGARVGTSFVLDEYQLALQPFVTGSVWREFAGSTETTFVTPGTSVPLTVTRIGTFGQVGLGVSGQVLTTGLLGYVRGDYRFGDHIEGYAVVGGLRYQF